MKICNVLIKTEQDNFADIIIVGRGTANCPSNCLIVQDLLILIN